ncbi:MAG: hypothetical protein QOG64_2320, partial [Acidimicrobiaceae bacterium]|nr:hypothetical protein [Acidimicrobiaceae bacterium]
MPGRQPLMRSAALALIVALASTTLAACAAAPGGTQPGTAAPARPRADVDPALAGTSGAGGSVAVIVQQRLADDRTAVRAVASLGGHVTRDLP